MERALFIAALFVSALGTGAACSIESGGLVLFARGGFDAVGRSDCPSAVVGRFNELLKSSKGSVSAGYVEGVLAERFGTKVSVAPRRIEIRKAAGYAHEALSLAEDRSLRKAAFLDGGTLLVPEGGVRVGVECSDCTGLGKKQIRMTLIEGDRTVATRWLKAELSVAMAALVAVRTLTFDGKPLSAEDFEKRDVYTMSPDGIFVDAKKIAFYRINKTILKGGLVVRSDLSPLRLVSPAREAEIFYRNGGLSLRTKAFPLKNGHYGEDVPLRARGNRTIVGKVVDHNKVVVEI